VVEREMDDRVHVGGGLAQAVQVVEIAAARLRAEGPHGLDRGVGPGQANDFVAGPKEFRQHRRADVAAGARDKNTHGRSP
jgi:hypothetical protein